MYSKEQRREIVLEKEAEIEKILYTDGVTYGMAKSVLDWLSADLQRKGVAFLNQSQVKEDPHSDAACGRHWRERLKHRPGRKCAR